MIFTNPAAINDIRVVESACNHVQDAVGVCIHSARQRRTAPAHRGTKTVYPLFCKHTYHATAAKQHQQQPECCTAYECTSHMLLVYRDVYSML